jgi:sarcosine oxidase subunit beta
MLGLDLPVAPERHQILVTEPVKACHDPMVIDLQHNIYFSQAKHGAFITGHTDYGEPSSFNIRNNWQFAIEISRKLSYLAPPLKRLKIVRIWAGLYTMTPDAQPIIGPTPQYPNFLNAIGFSGHGFMLAPVTGTILAELIVNGKVNVCPIEDFDINRFADGAKFTKEANVV